MNRSLQVTRYCAQTLQHRQNLLIMNVISLRPRDTMDFVIENNILKGVEKPVNTDQKLGPLIYHALNENPDHVAQIDAETGKQTYLREMKDRSIRCAVWMKKFGIRPQDIVVVITHNHLDSYIPIFATFLIDAILNPWNPNITLYTAQRCMKKFRPKMIFTCERAADILREAAQLENLEVELVVFGEHSEFRSLNEILNSQTSEEVSKFEVVDEKKPEDVAAIMLSSGTTGFPKGVMLSNRSLTVVAGRQTNTPSETLLWYSTPDWISCMILIIKAILRKTTRVISGNTDLENFFRVVEKYKVNSALIPPILLSCIAKSNAVQKYDLRSMRTVMIGGSKTGKTVLEALQNKLPNTFVLNIYATTETIVISLTTPKTRHIESNGYVVANCQIKFVDLTSGKTLGPNQNGEVCVKTPNIMIGYYEDPEATSRAFDEEGWYRTGDIGYYNEQGEIFLVDRIKEIAKYRNHQISPSEIEEVLLSHPQVQEAAVVAIPHELDGSWPVAFVQITTGSRVTVAELMKLTSVLEDHKKLRGGIHIVDNLPRTGSGKIAKHELKRLAKTCMHSEGSQR